jgi:DNA-binding NarL/FixJ family response regulator
MKSIALINNQTLLAEGLLSLLKLEKAFNTINVVKNEKISYLDVEIPNVDLVIVEINMQNIDDLDLLRFIRTKQIPVLIYSKQCTFECFQKIVKMGIQGYVTQHCTFSEIVEGITTITQGGTFYSKSVVDMVNEMNKIKKGLLREKVVPALKISKREREIIRLIRKGFQSRQIGEELEISVRTVGKHRENIMRKCNVGNVTELIYFLEKHDVTL